MIEPQFLRHAAGDFDYANSDRLVDVSGRALRFAADEIERLRVANAGLSRLCTTHGKEVVSLRGLLWECRHALISVVANTPDGPRCTSLQKLVDRLREVSGADQPSAGEVTK